MGFFAQAAEIGSVPLIFSYNGVDLGKMVRAANVSYEPVYDPSGAEVLYKALTIEVVAHINPADLSTQGQNSDSLGNPVLPPVLNFPNQRPGFTLQSLQAALLTPRRQLVWRVGSDAVIVSPAFGEPDPITEEREPLPCDCANGPIPEFCKVLAVHGAKTIPILYRVKTFIREDLPGEGRVVLSHRWSIQASTNEQGYTTRRTSGRIVVRSDLLTPEGQATQDELLRLNAGARVFADQFRAALPPPVPANFIRRGVEVQPLDDGVTYEYTFEDRETALNLGTDSPAVRVKCYATAGIDTPVKNIKDFIGNVFEAGKNVITLNPGGFLGTVSNWVPVPKANCIVQVWGNRACDKNRMMQLALNVALDKFAPLGRDLGGLIIPVSAFITQGVGDEDEDYIEARFEFFAANLAALAAMFGNVENVGRMMSLSHEINNGGFQLSKGAIGNPPLPGGDGSNTRGSYVGTLITQLLTSGDYELPPPVPAADVTLPSQTDLR
jgi:hypothetical protein